MVQISYKLEHFEGPLDLLLHLIEKNKVNIYDIPIAEITNQYLEYVRNMEREDLNVVSEFLVMAATLLDIKARMLLPKEVDEEGEEIDPRAELVQRLLEYKTYRLMADELARREDGADRLLYKSPTIPPEVAKYEPPVDLDSLLDGLTLAKLKRVFEQVMKRKEDKVDPIRSNFGTIRRGAGEPGAEDRIGAWLCQEKPAFQLPPSAGGAGGQAGGGGHLSGGSGVDEDRQNPSGSGGDLRRHGDRSPGAGGGRKRSWTWTGWRISRSDD